MSERIKRTILKAAEVLLRADDLEREAPIAAQNNLDENVQGRLQGARACCEAVR